MLCAHSWVSPHHEGTEALQICGTHQGTVRITLDSLWDLYSTFFIPEAPKIFDLVISLGSFRNFSWASRDLLKKVKCHEGKPILAIFSPDRFPRVPRDSRKTFQAFHMTWCLGGKQRHQKHFFPPYFHWIFPFWILKAQVRVGKETFLKSWVAHVAVQKTSKALFSNSGFLPRLFSQGQGPWNSEQSSHRLT